jgi:hypothetical protein
MSPTTKIRNGNMTFDFKILPDIELLCLNSILGLVVEADEPISEWMTQKVNTTIIEAVRIAIGESDKHNNKNIVAIKWCEQNIELFKKIDIDNITMVDYANIRLLYGDFKHRIFKIAALLED